MRKKGSIQTWKDFGIAACVLIIAATVILLITMPIYGSFFTNKIYDTCCDEIDELPENSTIWLCQYLIYYTVDNGVIRMDLNDEETWLEYNDLITNLTGLETKEEWTDFCKDMLNKEPCVSEYLIERDYVIISCIDCEEFQELVKIANDNNYPVKIVMYDCCCIICPFIMPVFIY